MAQQIDGLKSFYDKLSTHVDVGEYEPFAAAMNDSTRRNSFFDNISKFVDVGDRDTFNEKIDSYFGTSISTAPMQSNAAVSNVPAAETPLLEAIPEEFKQNLAGANIAELGFGAAIGIIDDDSLRAAREKYQQMVKENPVVANGFLKKAVVGLAGILAPMGKGIIEGLKGGTAGATVAALAGPGAPITVPAGFEAGFAGGSGFYWYKQGVGSMYNAMTDQGVNHTISSFASLIAGIPYAAIEMLQVGRLAPKFGGTVKKEVANGIIREIGKRLAKYGVDITAEVSQEVLQELISVATEEGSKVVSNILAGTHLSQATIDAITERLKATADQTFGPMALLLLPKLGTSFRGIQTRQGAINTETGLTQGIQGTQGEEQNVPQETTMNVAEEQQAPVNKPRAVHEVLGIQKSDMDKKQAVLSNYGMIDVKVGSSDPSYTGLEGKRMIGFNDPITHDTVEMDADNVTPNGVRDRLITHYTKWVDDDTYGIAAKAELEQLSNKAGKDFIKVQKETVDGDVVESPRKVPLNNRLFGLAKKANVTNGMLFRAMENGLGIKDIKFVGDGAITEEQVSELMQRLSNVNPDWVDSQKEYYLEHGDLPIPDDGTLGMEVIAPNVITAVHRGGIFDSMKEFGRNIGQSWETILRKSGSTGVDIAERKLDIQEFRDRNVKQTLKRIDEAAKYLNSSEFRKMQTLIEEGKIGELTPKQKVAFNKIDSRFKWIDTLATALKLQVYKSDMSHSTYVGKGTSYWPHIYAFDHMKSIAKQERLVKSWMERDGLTREEAIRNLDYLTKQRTKRRNPNLEYAREFNTGGWIGDPKWPGWTKKMAVAGLKKYFMGAYSRLGEAIYFDANGKNLPGLENFKSIAELISEEENPDKRRLYSNAMKALRGMNASQMERPFFSMLKNINILQLLGLANIPNAFQLGITVLPKSTTLGIMRGSKTLMAGLRTAMKNPGFARDEVGAAVMQNMREITGLTSRGITGTLATGYLRMNGFSAEESANNIVSASFGMPYVKEVFKMAKGESPSQVFGITIRKKTPRRLREIALHELKDLGFSEEVLKQDYLTDLQIKKAAWRMARKTQFRGGAINLPPLWTGSEYGKLATQFKTFSFSISKLAWHDFAKPFFRYVSSLGRHGTPLPLLTFLAASASTGEAIFFIRSAIVHGIERLFGLDTEFRKRASNVFARAAEDVITAGTLGLWIELYEAAKYNRPLEAVFGPTAGRTSETVKDITHGNIKELVRKQIPIIRNTKVMR